MTNLSFFKFTIWDRKIYFVALNLPNNCSITVKGFEKYLTRPGFEVGTSDSVYENATAARNEVISWIGIKIQSGYGPRYPETDFKSGLDHFMMGSVSIQLDRIWTSYHNRNTEVCPTRAGSGNLIKTVISELVAFLSRMD